MSDNNETIDSPADADDNVQVNLGELVQTLETGQRRERQHAATAVYGIALEDPQKLVEHIDVFIDALNRPEAQTRWEILETLTILVDYDSRGCFKALPEAETSLFDEESGPVRLGAMRFLCKLGATTANRSEKVWPLIDEAIQCYHGDLEFNDMLVALIEFSKGKLSPDVKKSFADRMSFDAQNARGTLKKRAITIMENLS